MKHKVYKAVDNLDNRLSYFYFNYDRNTRTIISTTVGISAEEFISECKVTGGHWELKLDTESRMINPVLIAEW